MKNKIIVMCIFLSSLFVLLPFSNNVSALGFISFEFDPDYALNVDNVRINDGVIAVAYTGLGDDGYLKTLSVSTNGSISSIIDFWEFDVTEALEIRMVYDDNYIFLSYRQSDGDGFLRKIYVSSSGFITKSFIDSYQFSGFGLTYMLKNYDITLTLNGKVDLLYVVRGLPLVAYGSIIQFVQCNKVSLDPEFTEAIWKAEASMSIVNYSRMVEVYSDGSSSLIEIESYIRLDVGPVYSWNCTTLCFSSPYDMSPIINRNNYTATGTIAKENFNLLVFDVLEFSVLMVKVYASGANSYGFSYEIFFNGDFDDDDYIDYDSWLIQDSLAGALKTNNDTVSYISIDDGGATDYLRFYNWSISPTGFFTQDSSKIIATGNRFTTPLDVYFGLCFSKIGTICLSSKDSANHGRCFSIVGLDDYDFTEEEFIPEIPQENVFYLNLIDGSTDEYITGYLNGCFIGPPISNSFIISIYSDLWSGTYCNDDGIFISPETIDTVFVSGNTYNFNIECFRYGGDNYQNKNISLRIFNGNTYNIILYPEDFGLWGNEYIFIDGDGLTYGIRTDKGVYEYPEQIRIQYKLPSATELISKGHDIHSFYIRGYIPGIIQDVVYRFNCSPTNNEWTDADSYDPPLPSTGFQRYNFLLWQQKYLWIIPYDRNLAIVYCSVYDASSSFTPSGNITSIEPVNPLIGDTLVINYNANNNGKLTLTHVSTNDVLMNQEFLKPVGNSYFTYLLTRTGLYKIDLYVFTGIELTNVDSLFFWVNGTNNTYESMGYNTEYLLIEKDRLIAGYDYVVILYRTLINNTVITIDSPKNARSPFSTTVSNTSTYGTYRFLLPSWATIGAWTVTMFATETLNDTFHVVADEHNFAEFRKNSYTIGESIDFYIRHNTRCKVIFYKNDVPYGEDIFFDNESFLEGYYALSDTSFFTPGTWELQLWETNNRIPIRLLSSDYAEFAYGKITTPEGIGDIFVIEEPFSYFIGTFIIILFTCLPLLITKVYHYEGDMIKYISIFMGITGYVLSILMGFFPVWTVAVFIILIGVISFLLYNQNKSTT